MLTHDGYMIGTNWERFDTLELRERAKCKTCQTIESSVHILTGCQCNGQQIIWDLAKEIHHHLRERFSTASVPSCTEGFANWAREPSLQLPGSFPSKASVKLCNTSETAILQLLSSSLVILLCIQYNASSYLNRFLYHSQWPCHPIK